MTEQNGTAENKELDASQLFADRKLEIQPVKLKSRGGLVYVRELRSDEHGEMNGHMWIDQPNGTRKFDEKHVDAWWAIYCCCDSNRKALFTEADLARVRRIPTKELSAIVAKAREINAIDDGAMQAASGN